MPLQPTTDRGLDPLKKLSHELHDLAGRFSEHQVTLQDVMGALGSRASGLLSVILALPFCMPVAIPGLSIPFGFIILMLAARFALGLPPWLPVWLLDIKLQPRFFRGLLDGTGKFVGIIERRLKPRLTWLTDSPAKLRWHSLMVCGGAFLLLLPIVGFPFTNTLPALVIVIGTLGMMEQDGVAVLVGYAVLLATLVYFGAFATVLVELYERASHWIFG